MEEAPSKEQREAQMLNAMNRLAQKHGCKVVVDFEKHIIDFDCPNKESELALALEIKEMVEPEGG